MTADLTTRLPRAESWLKRNQLLVILLAIFPLTIILPAVGIINPYINLVLKYIGINIILTISLNLVNGYMGEFSVGHAGFMAIGAYVASILTVLVIPDALNPFMFPITLVVGGVAAGIAGLAIAFPSFRTRGDYLAIVTLAFQYDRQECPGEYGSDRWPARFYGYGKIDQPGLGIYFRHCRSVPGAQLHLFELRARRAVHP
jgi:hypothetical protein